MKLTTCLAYAGLIAALSCEVVSAITIRHDVPRSEYDALAERYPSVGFYGSRRPDPDGETTDSPLELHCSGTLVSPTHILTAAHCLDFDFDGVVDADLSSLVFGFDSDFSDGTASDTHSVVKAELHPNWFQSDLGGGDLAVLTLSEPVTHIAPTPIYLGDPLGAEITYVGYGSRDVAYPEGLLQTRRAAIKSAANNVVDDVDRVFGLLGTDLDGPDGVGVNFFGSSEPLPLEGTVAAGDSGGGVFINVDGKDYLAGVISFGFPDFEQTFGYNETGYSSWLGHAGFRDFLASYDLVAVPEPGGTALLTIALSMLGLVRSRQL